MRKQASKNFIQRILLVAVFVSLLSAFSIYSVFTSFVAADEEVVVTNDQMLFVGDVFLGRQVERYMKQFGEEYPFKRIQPLLSTHTDVIGNFESSIPKRHVETKNFGFVFSVPAAYAGVLSNAGFSGVSLANNHAFDHGEDGFNNAKEVLKNAHVNVSGHPTRVTREEVQFYDLNTKRVALVPLNLTFGSAPAEDAIEVLKTVREESDYQVVYVHWGVEYITTANKEQQRVAHAFVDAGADAVIGHHPHVVQNIERYKDGLIFYSLGNFIFDQYSEIDYQQGLTLSLSFEDGIYSYTLNPVTSEDRRSSPRLMDAMEQKYFLRELADRSDSWSKEAILGGVITQTL